MKSITVLSAALGLGMGGVAAAQQDEAPALVLGAGLGANFEPYAALDDAARLIPIPLVSYTRGRLSFSGKQLAVNVFETGPWQVAGILDYRFQGFEEGDSPVFAGMDDREGTLEAGGRVAYDMGPVTLRTQALFDTLGRHGGFEVEGTATYEWRRGRATSVSPYLGIVYQSEDFNDYYYGVRDDEAAAFADVDFTDSGIYTRNAYAPGESINPFTGITVRQALSEQWIVFVTGNYTFLPDELKDSPLVQGDPELGSGDLDGKAYRASLGFAIARVF
jgi:outer membrane protein